MVVTLRDVAGKANVSIGTASHVLNGKDRAIRISESTRKRVFNAAAELNYQPNAFARSLRTRKSNTIGVCAAYLLDQYTSTILQYVNRSAHEKGYRLMLSFLEEQEDPIEAIHDAFGGGTVDGILIRESSIKLDDQSIIRLHKEGINLVLVGREVSGSSIPAVLYDNFKGGYLAAEHLLNLGHERIAIVMPDNDRCVLRKDGACDAISKHGHATAYCINKVAFNDPAMISKQGYEIGAKLAEMKERPTAIIAYDDVAAFGIILAIKAHGLRVPEDIAVVGFDDMVNISAYYDPPLTSVRPPYEKMGEAAVNLLVDIIDGKTNASADTKILLDPTLTIRKSSGTARN